MDIGTKPTKYLLTALAVLLSLSALTFLFPQESAAITGSTLTYGSDGTNTTTYRPASFSYAANNLILAAVANGTTSAGGLDVPTLSGTLNWVFVGTISFDTIGSPTGVVSLFRAMRSSPGTENVTITFGRNQSNCLWTIAQFAGVDESGTDGSGAVIQSKTGHIDSNKGYSITLNNPISQSANASVGAFANNMSGGGAVTAPPGYGSTPPVQYSSTPNISLLLDWQVPGLQTVSVAGSNSSHLGGVVAEIKAATTTLGNGSDPSGAGLPPGGAATMVDSFTFQTNFGTDTISAIKVTLAAGTYAAVGLIEITDPTGSTVYGSISNPAGDTVNVPLSTNITATTSISAYNIRITPKSHSSMPVAPGSIYNVTAYVSDWTDANNHAGSDSGGTTITIDNLSPANVTGATTAPDDQQTTLNWTNPADADLGSIVVLRKMGGAVGDNPAEGATYTAGSSTVGSSSVACVVSPPATSCIDGNLTNNVTYYYKIFTRDVNGNYSVNGVAPAPGTSGSVTPQRYQPDVMIKLASEGAGSFLGDNTYEATTTTQHKPQGVPSGSPATYHLRFQNDGSTTDSLVITGTGNSASFTVHYLDGSSTDRTAAVTGTGYTLATLAASAYQDWTLQVTPNTAGTPVPGGTSYEVFATATSTTNNTRRDQVKAVTTSTSANITLLKSSDKGSYKPGEDITYTTVATNGAGLTSAKNIAIIDPIPLNTGFKLGGATFAPETSTLTGAVSYSNAGTVTYTTGWGYVPASEGCGAPVGYDYCVTHVKWNMTETTPPGMPSGTSFSMNLVVKVK